MPDTATLSDELQIAIPRSVVGSQNWSSGQEFAFIPKDGGVMIVPVPSLDELDGIAEGADTTEFRDRDDHHR